MSAAAHLGRRLGNELYRVAFPVYRPIYGAFKAYVDRAERRLLADQLSLGSVVVDAGANVGIYSQFLSKCVGPSGTVHSFEPSPENFAHLYATLSDHPNVRVNQLAVSDKTGESLLYISDDLNVDHRAYPTDGLTRRIISVQAITLDDYFRSGERVDLIKMDIQGFELHALRGAERVLAENPSVKLLIEYWPHGLQQAGNSPEALLSFLSDRGLKASVLRSGGLADYDPSMTDHSNAESYFNLFIQPADTKA